MSAHWSSVDNSWIDDTTGLPVAQPPLEITITPYQNAASNGDYMIFGGSVGPIDAATGQPIDTSKSTLPGQSPAGISFPGLGSLSFPGFNLGKVNWLAWVLVGMGILLLVKATRK